MSLGLNGSSAGAGSGCVVGTYTGTGSSQTLTFDAPVKAMIIRSDYSSGYSGTYLHSAVCIGGLFSGVSWGMNSTGQLTGVTGSYSTNGNSVTLSAAIMTASGRPYYYIAFF